MGRIRLEVACQKVSFEGMRRGNSILWFSIDTVYHWIVTTLLLFKCINFVNGQKIINEF
jgi:hypothetical protein